MKFIDDVLAGRVSLPTVPRVIERVLTVMRQDDASLADVADEIEQDPVLGSRVLRLANSSFFAGQRSHASIADAVSVIGFRSLQTLVVASGAMAAFVQVPGVNLRQFWMTAVITASSARQIARRLGVDAETAYGAGLLQGVGHLILCQCHPQAAEQGLARYQALWGFRLAEREVELFGVAHPAVSAIWVDRLGVPAAVVEAIAHSLEPLDRGAPKLGRVVQLASGVAALVSAGETVESAVEIIDAALLAVLDLEGYLESPDFGTDFADLSTLPAPL